MKLLFAILKNRKNSCKLQSKEDAKAIRTTQPPANSTKADSEAFLPNRMQLVSLRVSFPLQLFHWNSCKIFVFDQGFTRRSGLVRPASKSCRFSHHPLRVPKAWHGNFAACGQRSGLLALNLANIFEKLLDQKTFILPAAHNWKSRS